MGLKEPLNDAFLHELIETFAKAFVMGAGRTLEVGEALGDEARCFVKDDAGCLGERITDAQIVVADDADDIAGLGFVHGLAFAGKEALGVGEPDVF